MAGAPAAKEISRRFPAVPGLAATVVVNAEARPGVPACADLSRADARDRVSLWLRCALSQPVFRLIP
jgi:hypothetical protein